jgi:hypothetical protein
MMFGGKRPHTLEVGGSAASKCLYSSPFISTGTANKRVKEPSKPHHRRADVGIGTPVSATRRSRSGAHRDRPRPDRSRCSIQAVLCTTPVRVFVQHWLLRSFADAPLGSFKLGRLIHIPPILQKSYHLRFLDWTGCHDIKSPSIANSPLVFSTSPPPAPPRATLVSSTWANGLGQPAE